MLRRIFLPSRKINVWIKYIIRSCTTVMPTNMFRILNQDVGGRQHQTCMERRKMCTEYVVVKQLEERIALKTTGQK
jgi:hypothetical protein